MVGNILNRNIAIKTSKILIRWFVDFDKEEAWLNEQSAKGWGFWHTNGVIYRFKACQPGEFIYQIDFDEKKSAVGEDYVVFRNSCGDSFVHQWKSKIYWKRKSADGPFETEGNTVAKLQLTSKAFNFHLRSFIGLTVIVAIAYLILNPLGRYLPESVFSHWLTDFSAGLSFGILCFQMIVLLPVLTRLRRKMNSLIKQLY